jgi:radical SAM protein with 4Fe4S-binding SPASM domain
MMPKALWEKVLHEIGQKQLAGTVFFHVLGEPLLHKDVFDAIRLANSYNLSVSLYTNGALLDQDRTEKLLAVLSKGRIVLSLQTMDPEEFVRRSRGKLSMEQYFERLINFIKRTDSRPEPLAAQIHYMADVSGKVRNYRNLLREQKRLQKAYDHFCDVLGRSDKSRINIFNPAASYPLGVNSTFYIKHSRNWDNQLIDDSLKVIPRKSGHCALMTDTFAVLADGTCTYCCDDYEGKLNLGNAHNESLENIYFGEKASALRRAERSGRFTEKHCRICRGRLVNKRTGKAVSNFNLLVDFYVLRDHFKRYGLKSSARKVAEVTRRSLAIRD